LNIDGDDTGDDLRGLADILELEVRVVAVLCGSGGEVELISLYAEQLRTSLTDPITTFFTIHSPFPFTTNLCLLQSSPA